MSDGEYGGRTPEEIARRLPQRPLREIGQLGREIYQRDIRDRVLSAHEGEYVSIDVDSGMWALHKDRGTAVEGLRKQCPEATDIYSLRVGYRAVATIGAGAPQREQ